MKLNFQRQRKVGHRPTKTWPVLLLCLPAFVAIWGGWVGLGEMTGFGVINMLPGMTEDGGWATVNTAVTLPIGLETYAAYALHAALNTTRKGTLRTFATGSALAALVLGGGGQLAFHLLKSFEVTVAPWQITAVVATIPVMVLGAGTALAALIRREDEEAAPVIDAPDLDETLDRWAPEPLETYQGEAPEVEMPNLEEWAAEANAPVSPAPQRRPRGEVSPALKDAITALIEMRKPEYGPGASRPVVDRYAHVLRILRDDPNAVIDAAAKKVRPELVDEMRAAMRELAPR